VTRAIIFDFDGVIADSEVPANRALAESLTTIGLPTSFEESLRDYYGHNWQETQRRIEEKLGAPLPDDFRSMHRQNAQAHFSRGFAPVRGAADFLRGTTQFRRAIASSSNADYIRWALDSFGLNHHFADQIHSADGMDRGKPYPDIYLQAAAALGIQPADCLAIEDSPTGARAAVAAGMTVVGLVAADHILDRAVHAEQLRAVGVHQIAESYAQIVY
jgi:HAD superfamily hydrolase (TIGR01509 family)